MRYQSQVYCQQIMYGATNPSRLHHRPNAKSRIHAMSLTGLSLFQGRLNKGRYYNQHICQVSS